MPDGAAAAAASFAHALLGGGVRTCDAAPDCVIGAAFLSGMRLANKVFCVCYVVLLNMDTTPAPLHVHLFSSPAYTRWDKKATQDPLKKLSS